MNTLRTILILMSLSLAACTATTEPATPAATQAPEKEPGADISDAIHAPIDKAEKVEDQVKEGADKQKADIEAAGG